VTAVDPPPAPDPSPDPEAARQELRNQAVAWLQGLGPSVPACLFCGQKQWHVTEPVVLREHGRSLFDEDVSEYPVFQVVCQTCGYTHLFNAVRAGLVESDTELRISTGERDDEAGEV